MKKMTNITVSLTKQEKEIFEALQKEETRGPSDQFRHMMKSYVKQKFPKLMKIYEENTK